MIQATQGGRKGGEIERTHRGKTLSKAWAAACTPALSSLFSFSTKDLALSGILIQVQIVLYSTFGRVRSTWSNTTPLCCQTFMNPTKLTECLAGSNKALLPYGTTMEDVSLLGRMGLSG